jgi:chromate transporter
MAHAGLAALSPSPVPEHPARPDSPRELFFAFNRLALQGFGGVLPVAQRELVERRRWMSREQFVEMLSIAQVLPGPNIVNMALMLGDGFFGWRGAAASMAGLLLLPLLIVLMLAALYGQLSDIPIVAGALRGMGAVAAGLVVSTALKLGPTLKKNVLGLWPCLGFALLTLLLVGGLRWPLAGVVLGLGSLSMWLAWWRLAP